MRRRTRSCTPLETSQVTTRYPTLQSTIQDLHLIAACYRHDPDSHRADPSQL